MVPPILSNTKLEGGVMENLFQDIRYGIRVLLKNPSFTAVAVLSLVFGIGANTAIFSLIDKMLLQPLPVERPEQLVILSPNNQFGINNVFNYPLYKDYRDQNEVFEDLIAYSEIPLSLSGEGQPERVYGLIVTGNYFSTLGAKPSVGRAFLPEEDQTPGSHPVAVVSHRLWQRRFGGDPNLAGKTINLNGYGFTVIGIAPAEFSGTTRGFTPDIYVPMMMLAQATGRQGLEPLTSRGYNWLSVMGRLKPGVGREQAQASMRTLASQIKQVYPMNTITELNLLDASRGDTSLVRDLSTPLYLLMIVVGLVLLIACANVANLLLARAAVRHKEIAIRLAVGASRGRLVRQLLTESVLLSTLGGMGGLILALWISSFWVKFTPPTNLAPIELKGGIDLRVLAFSFLLMLLTGLIFGLVPALYSSKPDIAKALNNQKIAFNKSKRRLTTGNFLVIAQVALSLAVLISAGLCVRSLRNLQIIDAGFESSKVLAMTFNLRLNGYNKDQGQQFYNQVIERVGTLPAVETVSLAQVVPLGGNGPRHTVKLEGYEPQANEAISIDFNVVSPEYFQTLGIPLMRGRDFSPQDTPEAPKVVVINQAMIDRYWPGLVPVGKHIRLPASSGNPEQTLEIIGVVQNSKYRSLTEEAQPIMYLPLTQNHRSEMALHVRCATDPKELLAAVRREVNSLDPNLPVFDIKTFNEQKTRALYTARLAAMLLSAFSILALFMAAVGVYGVMAYTVSRRTHEIGIRMALGAQQGAILKLMMGEGTVMVAIGLLLGIAMAIAATRFFSSFLYGIAATDLWTIILASLLLTGATLLASFVPSRRATRIDPLIAIKYE